MLRGRKSIALAIAILTITGQSVIFADSKNNVTVEQINVEVMTINNEGSVEGEFNKVQEQRLQTRGVKETKLIGSDRYKTAVKVSQAGWGNSQKAILINGYSLADALTATPLAEEYNAPILLTEKDKVNADTLAELKRLGVKEVTMIGGDGVISNAQANSLSSQGFKVERISGVDRIQTSYNIAMKLKGIYANKNTGARKTVFIANGYKGLVDATSVASPSGMKDAVILYTNGTNLNGIKQYITTSADDVYLIGGTATISSGVESELKNTTNKRIIRLSGSDRKETNAKVVKEFYPNASVNKMYIAKDGSGSKDSNDLVDALAVGSLAGREKKPVILASGDLSQSQRAFIDSKEVKELVQVGDGKNASAFKQAVGVVNNVTNVPEDGLRLPTISYVKEQKLLRQYFGGCTDMAGGGAASDYRNTIKGNLYVKYGDQKLGSHTYGSANQEQYDKVFNHVKGAISSINFRHQPEWVYAVHHLNGQRNNSFVDPILKKNGINVSYGQWANNNKQVISYLNSGKLSKVGFEKLAIYKSVVNHVESKTPKAQYIWGEAYSAYDRIFRGITDEDATGQFRLLIGDIIGMNGMVAGNGSTDIANCVFVDNMWWIDGKAVLLKANMNVPLYKNERPFLHLNAIYEAPTVNLESMWTK